MMLHFIVNIVIIIIVVIAISHFKIWWHLIVHFSLCILYTEPENRHDADDM